MFENDLLLDYERAEEVYKNNYPFGLLIISIKNIVNSEI